MQESHDSAFLREQAAKCRRLAAALTDSAAAAALRKLADDYEIEAGRRGAGLNGVTHSNLPPPQSDTT